MFYVFKGHIGYTEKNTSDPALNINRELSDTGTSNLRVDHFKFIKNSKAKESKLKKNFSQYQPSGQARPNLDIKATQSFRNKDDQKPVLQLQNHNLVFMNPQISQPMTDRKHNRSALKNKLFTLQPDSVLDEESKLVKNPKLTYLKRYVANFNKNGTSQFPDGFWGNNTQGEFNKVRPNRSTTPGLNSNLSGNNDRTPTNTFGNYIPYNPNQASYNPSYKERELSIIDLQLPIKSNNCSFAQSSQSRTKKSEFSANDENNFLASNKTKNPAYKNSQSNSSILIENLDYSNVISRINAYQDAENQTDQAVNGNIIPEIDELIKFKSKDRSNTFLDKYLMNRQKKKLNQLSNSSNRLYETNFSLSKLAPFKSQALITGTNVSTNIFNRTTNNEVMVNSSLNNLSSNSLLIKRLKF